MDQNEVNVAFEILLEEIEEVFNFISKDGEEAFKTHDYEKARELIEFGERLRSFREKVKSLQSDWQSMFTKRVFVSRIKKTTKGRLKRGLRTPESEYKVPILEAIVELGGRAKVNEVLELVYKKMKNKLNEYDLSPLNSNPKQKRWENTAQWTRNTLVIEGLLSQDSPQGIWEITERGRQFLKNSQLNIK
ncbi:MAG: winged helix-turn-helix domain-containing protein [Candidatus Hydrogenedentes bacterium]|nr:winged helix-turn-helix domain-containing protein [Candidatus Hydrogenedentota bacterium]